MILNLSLNKLYNKYIETLDKSIDKYILDEYKNIYIKYIQDKIGNKNLNKLKFYEYFLEIRKKTLPFEETRDYKIKEDWKVFIELCRKNKQTAIIIFNIINDILLFAKSTKHLQEDEYDKILSNIKYIKEDFLYEKDEEIKISKCGGRCIGYTDTYSNYNECNNIFEHLKKIKFKLKQNKKRLPIYCTSKKDFAVREIFDQTDFLLYTIKNYGNNGYGNYCHYKIKELLKFLFTLNNKLTLCKTSLNDLDVTLSEIKHMYENISKLYNNTKCGEDFFKYLLYKKFKLNSNAYFQYLDIKMNYINENLYKRNIDYVNEKCENLDFLNNDRHNIGVYVFYWPKLRYNGKKYVKIGQSIDISNRKTNLNGPDDLKILTMFSKNINDEKLFHNKYKNLCIKGEYFFLEEPLFTDIKISQNEILKES